MYCFHRLRLLCSNLDFSFSLIAFIYFSLAKVICVHRPNCSRRMFQVVPKAAVSQSLNSNDYNTLQLQIHLSGQKFLSVWKSKNVNAKSYLASTQIFDLCEEPVIVLVYTNFLMILESYELLFKDSEFLLWNNNLDYN